MKSVKVNAPSLRSDEEAYCNRMNDQLSPALASASCAPPTREFLKGALCAVGAVSILGVTTHLRVPDLAALRFGVASLLQLPVLLWRGLALHRLGWSGVLALALGGGAPYALVVGCGLLFAPVAHASVFTKGIVPLTVAFSASLTLKEPLPPSRSLGLALIVCGALVTGGIGITSASNRQSIGHLCFLGAACLWAYNTVAARRARFDGLHAAAIAAVASLLCYLPIYLLLCGDRLLQVPMIDIIVQALYQGVLTAVISLALYGRAVSLIGASSAGAFIALGPVVAAIMAIPVLGEWPTATVWLAISIITAGVYLASPGRSPSRAANI
jgi:drug/metabolite transporter (DMT)-like permease